MIRDRIRCVEFPIGVSSSFAIVWLPKNVVLVKERQDLANCVTLLFLVVRSGIVFPSFTDDGSIGVT